MWWGGRKRRKRKLMNGEISEGRRGKELKWEGKLRIEKEREEDCGKCMRKKGKC